MNVISFIRKHKGLLNLKQIAIQANVPYNKLLFYINNPDVDLEEVKRIDNLMKGINSLNMTQSVLEQKIVALETYNKKLCSELKGARRMITIRNKKIEKLKGNS